MPVSVCVIYHSGFGHTAKMAESVVAGVREVPHVECLDIPVEQIGESDAELWTHIDAADAMIFGCPTYMGSPSAGIKKFMEMTSSRWMEQKWADKIAAGFTNSGSHNGDKQNTLVGLATFAAQHGMVWINLNILPGNNTSKGTVDDLNRMGSCLGAMAQSNIDQGPDVVPPKTDLDTARRLGERVARCTLRWTGQ